MKRELNKHQLRRRYRANLAQTFYMRADSISCEIRDNADGTCTAYAEALPCTGHPNVLGAYTGTRRMCERYIKNINTAWGAAS